MLYYEQWQRLLDAAVALRAFLEANRGALKMREATGVSRTQSMRTRSGGRMQLSFLD